MIPSLSELFSQLDQDLQSLSQLDFQMHVAQIFKANLHELTAWYLASLTHEDFVPDLIPEVLITLGMQHFPHRYLQVVERYFSVTINVELVK